MSVIREILEPVVLPCEPGARTVRPPAATVAALSAPGSNHTDDETARGKNCYLRSSGRVFFRELMEEERAPFVLRRGLSIIQTNVSLFAPSEPRFFQYSAREERERASIRFLSSVRTMNRLNARTGAQGLPEADPGQRFVHGAVAARNLRPRAEIRINPISSNENKYRSGR